MTIEVVAPGPTGVTIVDGEPIVTITPVTPDGVELTGTEQDATVAVTTVAPEPIEIAADSGSLIVINSGGGGGHVHHQSSPSTTWTVNHNLGRRVGVEITTLGGVAVSAAVQQTSLNQVVVQFTAATAGYAIIT